MAELPEDFVVDADASQKLQAEPTTRASSGEFTINSTFANRTTKELYPKPNGAQHFWSGVPLTVPATIRVNSHRRGRQQTTAAGDLKFARVYVDSQEELPTTRQFIVAFDISPPKDYGLYGSQLPTNYSMILEHDESIKEVIVRHGFIVDAIGFVVADRTGATTTKIFGGDRGNETKMPLQSGELLTQISGTFGNYPHNGNNSVVATLRIHTNFNPAGYGPYGTGELVTNSRNFISPSGEIVGFLGRHNNYLESIGVYLNTKASKAYAESGPVGPIDWNVVEVKLGFAKPSVVYEDNILGGKVDATVYGNGNVGATFSGN